MLLLFASSNPPKLLSMTLSGGSISLTDETLSKIAGTPLSMELSMSIELDMMLESTPPPVERPIPPRYYVWVYNLAGERVDVIA